jgi:hypothetical protein
MEEEKRAADAGNGVVKKWGKPLTWAVAAHMVTFLELRFN